MKKFAVEPVPTPMMAPVIVWVVDTGMPAKVARPRLIAPPIEAQEPLTEVSRVILLPMVVHDFSFWSLLSVPLFSLFFNSNGHSNNDFFPTVSSRNWLAASRRHQRHHAHYNGNYGFQFSFMDRLFGTRLPDRPEEARG